MRNLFNVALVLTLVSCGAIQDHCGSDLEFACDYFVGKKAKDGSNGKNGADGSNGKDGADGSNGKNGADGSNGKDGADGSNGKDGVDGKDGQSCTVVETASGASITCGDNVVYIDDGDDAINSPYSVVEIVDPCGNYPNYADEVLLKLYNGQYLVYFENGSVRHLSVLEPGNYQTTDKQKCKFRITVDGDYEEI